MLPLTYCSKENKTSSENSSAHDSAETTSNMETPPGNYRHYNTGRWTSEEKSKFSQGIKKYGKKWSLIQKYIQTRNVTQIRSHAQKHFQSGKDSASDESHKTFDDCHECEGEVEKVPQDKEKIMGSVFNDIERLYAILKEEITKNQSLHNIWQLYDLFEIMFEKAKLLGHTLRPLDSISLKKLASVAEIIDNLRGWLKRAQEEHEEYKKFQYIYSAFVRSNVASPSQFSFFSMLKSKPQAVKISSVGFQPYKK
jgi:SHAQKYF class myb-like DNA-binding protein